MTSSEPGNVWRLRPARTCSAIGRTDDLWWNDPDAVVLTGDLSEETFRFHATAIYATGGMILSGDDLTKISAERLAMLRKLQPPTGQAARFADDSLRVGKIKFRIRRSSVCSIGTTLPGGLHFTFPEREGLSISGVERIWENIQVSSQSIKCPRIRRGYLFVVNNVACRRAKRSRRLG